MEAISHPDKLLWPEAGLTKADLAAYYDAVADRLLTHLEDRAVTLMHSPRGVDETGFLRKDLPAHAPASIRRWTTWAHTARRDVSYAVIDDRAGLRWCAGQNVTEFHACLFRIDRPDRLDTVVIDLDPAPESVEPALAAMWIHEVLTELEVNAWVKTSGGRGFHVMVPVERRYDVGDLRRFADHVADLAVERHHDDLTTEFHKADRRGRLFVDCTRVTVGATLITAWSPRARSTPTVSTPLEWDELTPTTDPSGYTQQTAIDRPEPALPRAQRIDHVLRSLGGG